MQLVKRVGTVLCQQLHGVGCMHGYTRKSLLAVGETARNVAGVTCAGVRLRTGKLRLCGGRELNIAGWLEIIV